MSLHGWDQAKPNPVALAIATSKFLCRTSFDVYSGISNLLKHVWELGTLLSSVSLSLTMPNPSDFSPLTGARSLPVENCRSLRLWSSSHSSITSSQNHLIYLCSGLNPLPYLEPALRSLKFSFYWPLIRVGSSSISKSALSKRGSMKRANPLQKASNRV